LEGGRRPKGVKSALSTFRENSNGANGLIFDSSWKLLEAETNPA